MRKPAAVLKINTRPKDPDSNVKAKCRSIEINLDMLESHFKMPLETAAKSLGVAPTTLKWYFSICSTH